MTIAGGTRLGPYEIVSLIGVGGMGQVYRARDTRLDRSVAIKVLAPALAGDAGFRDRFEREARAISALNHPNVCTLHDVAPDYLVMELVEGESLEELIAAASAASQLRRPGYGLPLADALRIARQIADALEAAHDRGIVHRDLKPANVRVTPSGQVKVLDFGLAKVLGHGTAAAPTLAGTMTSRGTAVGVVMGTAAYMSPEQARGLAIDRRTDVWAFGCVLYELLTGTRPFAGETISDSIASLLTKDPDWTRLPPDTAASVRRLLRRALEKDPARRLRDIADARLDLDDTPEAPGAPAAAMPERRLSRPARVLPVVVLAVVASAITGVAVWRMRPAAAPRGTTRFSITLTPLRFTATQRTVLALSPDGRQLAFSAGPPPALYLRSMDDLDPRPLKGTEGAAPIGPVFSPDGQSIAFWSNQDQSLKRISVAGGAPLMLCPTDLPSGLTWSSDAIVFANSDGIYRVAPEGGQPEILIKMPGGETAFGPRLLPDGQTVLFTAADAAGGAERWDAGQIIVQAIGSSERKTIINGGTDARYMPSGHIVFARGGIVYAVPFDPKTLTVTGREVAVVEGVMRGTGTYGSGTINLTVSNDGTLAYLPGPLVPVATTASLARFDVTGGVQNLAIPAGSYQAPRVSPDGRHIAFITDDGRDVNVWVFDLGSDRAPRRVTFAGRNRSVAWTADSRRIAYRSDRDGGMGIYWQAGDGSGTAEALTKPDKGTIDIPLSFSPDGDWLLFDRVVAGQTTLVTLSLRDRRIAPFGSVQSSQRTGAVFSPDGKWVSYAVRERGRSNQLFVEPFPATGAKYLVSNSTEDAHHPVWSPDGKVLFYTPGPGNRAIRVPVTFTPAPSFGAAVVFERAFTNLASSSDRAYDMMPDGRFLSVTDPLLAEGGLGSMTVVLNWFEELKARVPAGK
jgi:Tol biopolymer transport system component